MLSEELLKQAAEELALAMNDSLPKPEQCQHGQVRTLTGRHFSE